MMMENIRKIFKESIAPFILSILASWVYDVFKQKGVFPASPKLIDIILGGMVFFTVVIIQNRNANTSNTGHQISWIEFLDRAGVIIQKAFIGISISGIVILTAYFGSIKYFAGRFTEDVNSGIMTQEQYTIYMSTYLPLFLLGGTIMCILGGQLSVFLGLYGSDRFPYNRPLA